MKIESDKPPLASPGLSAFGSPKTTTIMRLPFRALLAIVLVSLVSSLSLTGCGSTRTYYDSELWLTQEHAIEDTYLYGKVFGAPFSAEFYDSTNVRILRAPVDSLTRKQLVFIHGDLVGARYVDSLAAGDSLYYSMKRVALTQKFNLAIAIERAKHVGKDEGKNDEGKKDEGKGN